MIRMKRKQARKNHNPKADTGPSKTPQGGDLAFNAYKRNPIFTKS